MVYTPVVKCSECKAHLTLALRYFTKAGKGLVLCSPCHSWYKAKGV